MALLKSIGSRGGSAAVGWLRALRIFLAIWLGGAAMLAPAQSPPPEYQVKAVFLFNFAQFVEWPARAFAERKAPLVIGVLGEDPFGAYLDEIVRGEMIGERPMEVRRFRREEDITTCHILFVARSESAQLERIMRTLKGRSILTVGDADDFSRHGGMVRFVTESGKIRLRINLEAARESELTISSKILRAATIVTAAKG